ncbi:hypothetical protein AB1Y20_023285 [Prymnesium parvum]|uniref:Protein xylosyltransferase n=1 Tax=Prymnesium parvum TaxID=97485 RepID=A0AB34JF02_PRYPA
MASARHALRHNRTQASIHLSCAVATPSYAVHFPLLAQWFLTIEENVVDADACALLVVTSSEAEATKLRKLLRESYAARLPRVMQQLSIVDFHSALRHLSPATSKPVPPTKDVGRYGRLYICTKKFVAARWAHEVLNAEHVLVTDNEAYIWKPLSFRRGVFGPSAARPLVWYADAPLLHSPRATTIDQNFCSLNVFRDMRRVAFRERAHMQPSLGVSLFEDMGFFYPREFFRQYWDAVEAEWHQPFFDAVVEAFDAQPKCLQVGFWGEVSWLLYLYNYHRPVFSFRNITAAIERSIGKAFVRRSFYVTARLELLWRGLTNETFDGFVRLYRTHRIPFFRSEFRNARGIRGSRGGCLPVRLIAALPSWSAVFQVNSAVPNWVWEDCSADLPQSAKHPWVMHRVST